METSLYREVECKTIRGFNLRCIDGSTHGCCKCVGYCSYAGHPGFLTAEMQKEHRCIEKGCFYHDPKPATRKKLHGSDNSFQRRILSIAQAATAAMEGLRVIRVSVESNANCVVYYAAIAEYDVSPVAEEIAACTKCRVSMRQIPCDFNVAAALVIS